MKEFFDAVRPMFRRGKLSAAQVQGMEAVIEAGVGMPRSHLAYVLATVFHETGQRMQPVREGFTDTNEQAIRAVTSLFNKGIIRHNYALPHKNGQSYYGRGLIQLTHPRNYKKFGIYNNPEWAMGLKASVDILLNGMIEGKFRKGNSLSMLPSIPSLGDFIKARNIVNGDTRKNGHMIADQAVVFYNALLLVLEPDHEPDKEPHTLWCQLLDYLGLGDHSATGD